MGLRAQGGLCTSGKPYNVGGSVAEWGGGTYCSTVVV